MQKYQGKLELSMKVFDMVLCGIWVSSTDVLQVW